MKNDLNDRNEYKIIGGPSSFLPTGEIRFSGGLTHPQPSPPMQSSAQPAMPSPLPTGVGTKGTSATNSPLQPSSDPARTQALQGSQEGVSQLLPTSSASGATLPAKKKRSRLTRGLIAGSVVCLCIIVLLMWLTNRAVADVTLYQVGNQNVTHYVGGGGIVFPFQQLTISYPVSERVVSVLVKPGDQVTPNQSLIQLDPSQLNAQITQASNDVAAAQAYLNSVSAGGNSLVIAQAQQEYNLAKNKYNALVAEASSATLHKGSLVSPMSGVVTAVNINPGEVFSSNTPLITIMDESKVIVRVKVPLLNLQQVRLGQTATVTPSTMPNTNLPGVVSTIIPRADPQTDTFEVWVQVTNANKMLLPGMSAFARIQNSVGGVTVPRLAVLNQDRESVVFIVRNQHAYIEQVQVTGHDGGAVIVGKGLAPGDHVVIVGVETLRDGQAVRVRSVE